MTTDKSGSRQSKPTGIAVNRNGSDIEIVYLWFRWSAILQLFTFSILTILTLSFFTTHLQAFRSGEMTPLLNDQQSLLSVMFIELVLIFFFLRGVYAGVAGIINRTTIHIGELSLTTHTGPIPFLVRNREIDFKQIGRFFCDYLEVYQGRRDRIFRTRPFKLYAVYASTVEGNDIHLIGYLPQLKQAAYIVTVLRRLVN